MSDLQTRAQQELAARELSKRSLLNFVLRFEPDYRVGWAHHLICARLEQFFHDVQAKKSPRLMLFLPPRSGKSLLASMYFPAWMLGQDARTEIIAASYAVSLPEGFSRRIKQLMKDRAYSAMFPQTVLDPNAQATSGWYTTQNGAYLPSGVGSGITGRGAKALIIDDPVKDAEEADSDIRSQAVWDWYGSTARTRVAPGGGICIILTRWSMTDLAGRLLQQQKEQEEHIEEGLLVAEPGSDFHNQLLLEQRSLERWDVLSFPAIATSDEYYTEDHHIVSEPQPGARLLRRKGEALHPERYDETAYAALKRTLSPRHWSALYQQSPTVEEGAFFKKEMFRTEPLQRLDPTLPRYIAWDLAIGQKQQNDWTVGVVAVLDTRGILTIIDRIRFKGDTFEIVNAILDTYLKYRPRKIGIEQGHIQMAIAPVLQRAMRTRKLFPTFDDRLKPMTDKVARARPLQGMMQNGMVVFQEGNEWYDEMRTELMHFPNGTHDDCVDALSWMAKMVLAEPTPGSASLKEQKRLSKSWREQLKKHLSRTGSDRSYMGA